MTKKTDYDTRTVVLKPKTAMNQVKEEIDKKKTSLFRSFLKAPKKSDIHVHKIKLVYEPLLVLRGYYTADFFRKKTHTITVDGNVKEVVLGEGIFPVKEKSIFVKKLSPRNKNKVNLELEEHVFIENDDELTLDHHGKPRKLDYKIDSKSQENYPHKILTQNEVKNIEITNEAAIEKLSKKLKRPMEDDVRNLNDEITVKEMIELYIPIYEARLIGPKKQVKLLRFDAVRKKII